MKANTECFQIGSYQVKSCSIAEKNLQTTRVKQVAIGSSYFNKILMANSDLIIGTMFVCIRVCVTTVFYVRSQI